MIKVSELIKAVEAAGLADPERRSTCRYFNEDDTPCCIVGHGLHGLGFTAGDLRTYGEFQRRNGINVWILINEIPAVFSVDIPVEEVQSLIAAQAEQDKGKAWGEAVQKLGDVRPI